MLCDVEKRRVGLALNKLNSNEIYYFSIYRIFYS